MSTYNQSPYYVERIKIEELNAENKNRTNVTSSSNRSTCKHFDWKQNCFICGEKCDGKRDKTRPLGSWSLVKNDADRQSDNIIDKRFESC